MKHLDKNDEWNQFVRLLTSIQSEELMDQMLHLFLTINEREYVVDRHKIVKALLTTDKTQRKIAEELEVSIAKITVGSNELKRMPEELLDYFKKQVKKMETHEK